MTALVVAMAGVTAFVSHLHTQHDPGAGWLILALVMAFIGWIIGAGFVRIARRDITRNISEIARVARAVEVERLWIRYHVQKLKTCSTTRGRLFAGCPPPSEIWLTSLRK